MDFKEIKCLFKWWVKHEAIFSTIGFLACQTLKIIGTQIEIDFLFQHGYLQSWDVVYNQKILKDWYLWTKIGQMILGLIINHLSIYWSWLKKILILKN